MTETLLNENLGEYDLQTFNIKIMKTFTFKYKVILLC